MKKIQEAYLVDTPGAAAEYFRANGIRYVSKDHTFWKTLGWILKVVSFGQMPSFVDSFITTIGPLVAVPPSWPKRLEDITPGWRTATLIHEAKHVSQFKAAGLGNAWVGIVPMFFLYVLFPLPTLCALGRWWIERPAYCVNIRQGKRLGAIPHRYEIERATKAMTGSAYLWTLAPFGFVKKYVRNWFIKNYATAGLDKD